MDLEARETATGSQNWVTVSHASQLLHRTPTENVILRRSRRCILIWSFDSWLRNVGLRFLPGQLPGMRRAGKVGSRSRR